MSANVGDRITLHATTESAPARTGTVVAVLGESGPPYRVRFDSGEETVVSPGPDATITPPTVTERLEQAAQRTNVVATEAWGKARESAAGYSEKARESAQEYSTKAREATEEYRTKARESAQEYSTKAREASEEYRTKAQDATGRAARKVADAAAKIAERFER